MSRKKNIAILHYSCPPVVGGVEEIVRQQASLFLRHFYPVKVMAGRGAPFIDGLQVDINPLLDSNHAEISRLQHLGDEKALEAFTEKIFAFLREAVEDFDVLLAHNVLTMPYNLPLTRALHRLADLNSLKIVAWNHDSPYFYTPLAEELLQPRWQILKTVHPNITYIAISDSRAREFQELYNLPKSLPVIQNGIDPFRFFRLDKSTIQIIKEQQLFSADLILVQPSRLHPRKNIELSIQVLKAFVDQGVDAKFLLTGAFDPHNPDSVKYYHKLEGMARDLKVRERLIVIADYTFASGQKLTPDRVTIRDLYLIADVLFLPSKIEGFGIPLLEAGMIKLPIACTQIAPFTTIGQQDVFYFQPNDHPAEIAERLFKFLKGLNTFRMFRKVMRQYVWDNIFYSRMKPLLDL